MKINRRTFIIGGSIATLTALGTVYYLCDSKPLVSLICSKRSKTYTDALVVDQKISHESIEYPGLYEYDVVTKVELYNKSDKPLEKLLVLQQGSSGFELESVKVGRPDQFERDYEVAQAKVVDNTAIYSMPQNLEPNGRRIILFSYKPGWDAKSGDFQTTATAELYVDMYEPCWFTELFNAEKECVSVKSNIPPATLTITPTPKPLRELYESGKQDLARDIVKRKILMQYPVTEDLQTRFWKDPLEYADDTIDYFQSELDKSGEPFSELSKELDKIPEIAGTTKYQVDKIDVVKGVENLSSLALLYDTPEESIQAMLDEGYPNIRKYCTPLQTLLWLGKNELFSKEDNPLNPYDVKKLISRVWFSYYEPKNVWDDFDVVVDRLNSPVSVYVFMLKTFRYDRSMHLWQDPLTTFKKRSGHCADQSDFAAFCLDINGYSAYNYWVRWGNEWFNQHTICVFKEKNGKVFYLDTANPDGLDGIFGPFTSIKSLYNSMIRQPKPLLESKFYNVNRFPVSVDIFE